MGTLFLEKLAQHYPSTQLCCLVRPTSDRTPLYSLNLKLDYFIGDSAQVETWQHILKENSFDTIFHLVQLRQVPTIVDVLQNLGQTPHLIIIGTTGIYSKYNQYSAEYKSAEACLKDYSGSYCLLRPTMIYGSNRDKNIHKLIRFCHKYGFFPVFGSGENLIQPVHADDLAKVLFHLFQHPRTTGKYNLSGGTVVSLRQLLGLLAQILNKPIRQVSLPIPLGLALASIFQFALNQKSPIRVEQILRLQEDKAFCHDQAQQNLGFYPRSLEDGLRQEVQLMQSQNLI